MSEWGERPRFQRPKSMSALILLFAKTFSNTFSGFSPIDLQHSEQFDRHVRGCFVPDYLYWVMMYSVCVFFSLTAVKINLNRDKETICHQHH